MTSEAATSRKPRRRWLQFSLRTLLVLMVLVAGVAAWVGWELEKGRRQKEAIHWVYLSGGQVSYDDNATQNDWRRRWFGERFPQCVERISINYILLDDVEPLAKLENLRELSLSGTPLHDLTPLAELENLQRLDLFGTHVTDEQVQALQLALPNCAIVYD